VIYSVRVVVANLMAEVSAILFMVLFFYSIYYDGNDDDDDEDGKFGSGGREQWWLRWYITIHFLFHLMI